MSNEARRKISQVLTNLLSNLDPKFKEGGEESEQLVVKVATLIAIWFKYRNINPELVDQYEHEIRDWIAQLPARSQS